MTAVLDSPTTLVLERPITSVRREEDGWGVEVQDSRGCRLWYWIADSGCVPAVGSIARFIGGTAGEPIRGIEINGCQVF
jgi:hypothetical protein